MRLAGINVRVAWVDQLALSGLRVDGVRIVDRRGQFAEIAVAYLGSWDGADVGHPLSNARALIVDEKETFGIGDPAVRPRNISPQRSFGEGSRGLGLFGFLSESVLS
jgi:hypothetical protein